MTDAAACAADIFDDDALSERTLHPVGQYTGNRIGGATSRIRHDDRNNARWIVLRDCIKRFCNYDTAKQCDEIASSHETSLRQPTNPITSNGSCVRRSIIGCSTSDLGQKADVGLALVDVRFTPKSRHSPWRMLQS